MKRFNKLASVVAASVAITTLFGASAFAEERHSNETRHGGYQRSGDDAQSSQPHTQARPSTSAPSTQSSDRNRGTAESNRGGQTYDRSSSNRGSYDRNNGNHGGSDRNNGNHGSYDRNNGNYDRNNSNRGSYDRNNSNNRGTYNRGGYDNRGGYSNRGGSSYYGRQPFYTNGRVSRYERYNGGYRVWVGGSSYPFFIPEARWRLFPLRVGLSIRLGGYYNPLGFYDYYDGPFGGVVADPVYTSGSLRGVVESVDFRRGTFVLRDDLSGNFVTAVMRGNDRRLSDLRPGDSVDISGEWSRNGVFEAYRVDGFGDGYRR